VAFGVAAPAINPNHAHLRRKTSTEWQTCRTYECLGSLGFRCSASARATNRVAAFPAIHGTVLLGGTSVDRPILCRGSNLPPPRLSRMVERRLESS